jgi:large subunit ribosomal protein L1
MAEAKSTAKKSKKETEKPAEVSDAATNEAVETTEDSKTSKVAKAGKRSAKAVKEAEEQEAKQERKDHAKEEKSEAKPKHQQKPPRSKLERKGKKYREAAKQIEAGREYPLEDALNLAVKTSTVKFDATVELHLNLAVDPKQADQNVRGTVVLPAGTGKTSRVAVLAEAADAQAAKTAGADIAGSDDLLAQLDKEKIVFDVLIAHPSQMPKLGKYARLLGPKGLMPNPKSGTVTTDITKAVTEAKAGRVEYRVDTTGIVHVGIGKVSFGAEKLAQNARAIFSTLKSNKPASVKGAFILRAYATTTMGPSIQLSLSGV